MWLTSLFVRRPTLVFVLLALILLAGSIAWATLVRQQYPERLAADDPRAADV